MKIVNVYRRGAITPCYEIRGRYFPVRDYKGSVWGVAIELFRNVPAKKS